jgi:hypothetical protein
MKTKIIAIVLCVMLITTMFVTAKPLQKIENNSGTETITISNNVDVPVWEIGDTWTYHIDDISIVTQQDNKSLILDVSIAELPLTVISTNGDSYTLEFETTIDGQIKITIDRGNGPVSVSFHVSDLDISGTVLVDKTTLGRKEISASFKREKISIEIEQSLIPLPAFLQKFSARITMNLALTFDPSLSLLTFPLNTGTTWNLPATDITIDGTIQSFYLNLINFINKIAKLFGKEFLPSEISALLPIIDLEDALTSLGYDNVFSLPPVPNAFFCSTTENVTVPAGTYEAFNITLFAGAGQCYYAPTAGNTIKIIQDAIKIELLSTNYS